MSFTDSLADLIGSKIRLQDENMRLRAGLKLIEEAGMIHGAAWCVAQARGYLEDLDFNQYPENGKSR